jgi:hypothetical protein
LRAATTGDKMSKAKGESPVDPDLEKIRKQVLDQDRDDTVAIFIPSHDSEKKKLNDQDQWATAALKLFGKLYEGATAFTGLKGIWVDPETGVEHFDDSIMIQSLAKRPAVVNEENLTEILEFARQMCRDARQKKVAVIFNNTLHYIESR